MKYLNHVRIFVMAFSDITPLTSFSNLFIKMTQAACGSIVLEVYLIILNLTQNFKKLHFKINSINKKITKLNATSARSSKIILNY